MASLYGAVIFVIGATAILLIALFIFFQSSEQEETEKVTKKIYAVRKIYFFILVAVLIATLGFTLPKAPYFKDGEGDVVVKVTGWMWYWEVEPVKGARYEGGELIIPAGKKVEFRVTAGDVTHGVGIYNSEGVLLTQVQAMPDYTNKLFYTFNEPGVYEVFCLEYCGYAHHNMFLRIKVVKGE